MMFAGYGDDYTITTMDEVEYKIDSTSKIVKDADFIYKASSLDEIALNVCYEEKDGKKIIQEYELINNQTQKEVESKDLNSLIDELGYYQYGNYTEDATLISVGSASYGYDCETDKSSSLVENGNYTITFDVNEGIVNGFEYLLKDFNKK